jgi:hypothetical protein
MVSRTFLVERIAGLVGSDVLEITDVQSGWPALGRLLVDDIWLPVSLFVGSIGVSHRSRDSVERRFQNPGQARPIVALPGRRPLLLGLYETDSALHISRPLLVAADPFRRVDRQTRFSIFVRVETLQVAEATGWAEDHSDSDEIMRCFLPQLLPVAVLADVSEIDLPTESLRIAVLASGLDDPLDESDEMAAGKRTRRATSALVRDARFGRNVLAAYNGLCAMCDIDLDLVQGAHIYPASAPSSPDTTWNGLCLCANHHVAFDRHMIWVDPDDRVIKLHPRVLEQSSEKPAVAALVSTTKSALVEPVETRLRPRSEMFAKRYEHFTDRYAWAG